MRPFQLIRLLAFLTGLTIIMTACGEASHGVANKGLATLVLQVQPSAATVHIRSSHGGDVTFEGSRELQLEPGNYSLRASHEGYVTSVQQVELHADSTHVVDVELALLSPTPAIPHYDGFEKIHVNVASEGASDSNPGTEEQPLKAISEGVRRAVHNRRLGLPTHVIVHPGVYRESITGAYGGIDSSGSLIVIEALHPGTAVISGSDSWPALSCSSNICSAHWPFDWGFSTNPWPMAPMEPIGLRREMVFVNGVRLDQVLTAGEVAAQPGSFFVDESAAQITVHAPVGLNLAQSQVEVGVRPVLLELLGLNDLVLSGLDFEHAVSPFPSVAVNIAHQNNVVLHDLTINQNNWTGLGLMGSNITVVNSRMNGNGGSGFGAFQVETLQILDSEASSNNWRGFAANYLDWSVGQKIAHVHDLLIRNLVSTGNLTRGLWFDTDVKNAVVEGATICGNVWDGLFIEAVPGDLTIKDSTFCENGRSGILTSASHNLALVHNQFWGNAFAQINLSGDLRRTSADYMTGEVSSLRNENWYWRGNTFTADDDQLLVSTTLAMPDWQLIMDTSDLNESAYSASSERAFRVPNGVRVDFSEWRRATGQDESSRFEIR